MYRSVTSLLVLGPLALVALSIGCGQARARSRAAQPTLARSPASAATVEAQGAVMNGATATTAGSGSAGAVLASQTAPTACPIAPDACAYAAQLNAWMLAGDLDAIVAQVQPEEITCPIPGVTGQIGAYPLCEGSGPGEPRTGYPFGFLGSEGTMMTEEQYRETLQPLLTGSASLHAYGLSCYDETATSRSDCRSKFGIAFTTIDERADPADQRAGVVIFYAKYAPDGGSFRITDIAGGSYTIFVAQSPAYGTFLPWQPPTK